jgi:hypothetical protein
MKKKTKSNAKLLAQFLAVPMIVFVCLGIIGPFMFSAASYLFILIGFIVCSIGMIYAAYLVSQVFNTLRKMLDD